MTFSLNKIMMFVLVMALLGCTLGGYSVELVAQEQRESSSSVVDTAAGSMRDEQDTEAADAAMSEPNERSNSVDSMASNQQVESRMQGAGQGEDYAIQVVAAHKDIAARLANYPDWEAEAYPEENSLWGVDFYSEVADKVLAYGLVDLATGTIIEIFVPQELSPEEFQAGQQRVETLVLQDAEVLALLGDPTLWERETEYDPFEQMWGVWFNRGLESWLVVVYQEEDQFFIEETINPLELDAEEQRTADRDQAIELAYEAEGIDQALSGVDDWQTYVEQQGDSRWSVSFVTNEQELFYALVDIEQWQIIEHSNE